jgi:hypothetical protein
VPDFLAGQTLTALHFTPTVADTQDDLFTFDSTTFGEDHDSGTYIQCAVVFVAPTTGRVKLTYLGELDNSSASASTNIAPHVRDGATPGSGSDVLVPSLNIAHRNIGTDARRGAGVFLLQGLTAGNSYNVVLEHRVSGGIGTIQYRHLIAEATT